MWGKEERRKLNVGGYVCLAFISIRGDKKFIQNLHRSQVKYVVCGDGSGLNWFEIMFNGRP
jgi:hypothetical protein